MGHPGQLRRRYHLTLDAAAVADLEALATARSIPPTLLGALLLTDAIRAAQLEALEDASRAVVLSAITEAAACV